MSKKGVYAWAIFFLMAGTAFFVIAGMSLYSALTNPEARQEMLCWLAIEDCIFGAGMGYMARFTLRYWEDVLNEKEGGEQ